MAHQPFRGVFAIPVTPFDKQGKIDESSLRRCIDFCVAGGAHGIVNPVNASEFTSLTDDERKRVTEITIEQTNGRIPVVIGTSGVSTHHAVELSRYAAHVGADAVIAMPPYVRKATAAEIYEYYRALSAAVDIPIFIQDYIGPVGTPMSADLLSRMLRELEHVKYLKEEAVPAGHMMTAVMAKAGDSLEGVMGGAAGRYIMDEFRRGAQGTMPACEIVDLHVQLWDLLESGDETAAFDFYRQMLPLMNLESLYSFAVYKEVLHRRGVIDYTTMRAAGAPMLDDYDQRELDMILADLKPLFLL
ncbi:MAG: dihydrodipicolinate synthase family protein [Chloroflexi bacterium]|nr:dihydrodipicolinate synthase family protein [Chloroflexota bacterium]